MIDPVSFALAVVLVLAMPGPTNTLLATGAATTNFRNCLTLMPAEWSGYMISIGLLLLFVRPLADASFSATVALRSVCAGYLVFLAWTLWHSGERRASGPIRFRHVFITTLLNPKAVVFAFLIFPDSSTSYALQLRAFGLFTAICTLCCAGWLTLGGLIGAQAGSFITPRGFKRAAAVALAVFALVMLSSLLLGLAGSVRAG